MTKKRVIILGVVLLAVLGVVRCLFFALREPPADPSVKKELNTTYIPRTANWKTAGLKKAGLDGVAVSEPYAGTFGTAYLLTACAESDIFSDRFLAVETEEIVWLAEVSRFTLFEKVYLSDVDGKPGEEIIIKEDTGGVGGFGQYEFLVFTVTEKGISLLFEGYSFDTGFETKLQAPFQMVVTNRFTSGKTVLDFKEKTEYLDLFFDSKGNPRHENEEATFDGFYELKPEDVDGDGVFELVGTQYASLLDHADYIGIGESVLKFNPETGRFAVIESRFISAENNLCALTRGTEVYYNKTNENYSSKRSFKLDGKALKTVHSRCRRYHAGGGAGHAGAAGGGYSVS